MKKRILYCVACAAVLVQSILAEPAYTFIRLSPVGGDVGQDRIRYTNGGGINNNGVVVGNLGQPSIGLVFTYDINANRYAYYTLPDYENVMGIDNHGNIAYQGYTSASDNLHAAIYDTSTSTVTTFDEPSALPRYTFLTSMSSNGNIGGIYRNPAFDLIGYTKVGSTFADVTFSGYSFYVSGINNAGDVIGISGSQGANYLLKNGVYTQILDPQGLGSGGVSSNAMNDLDQVVGYYPSPGSYYPTHGFVWESGLSFTLDYPGAANTTLRGINDSGVILGGAGNQYEDFLFVAIPRSPEPTTLAAIGSALCLFGLRWRRRRTPPSLRPGRH